MFAMGNHSCTVSSVSKACHGNATIAIKCVSGVISRRNLISRRLWAISFSAAAAAASFHGNDFEWWRQNCQFTKVSSGRLLLHARSVGHSCVAYPHSSSIPYNQSLGLDYSTTRMSPDHRVLCQRWSEHSELSLPPSIRQVAATGEGRLPQSHVLLAHESTFIGVCT